MRSEFRALSTVLVCLLQGVPALAAAPAEIKISTRPGVLQFDQARLSAKPNQTIRLTFHNSEAEGSRMQHSWILTRPGKEAAVADAASAAGAAKAYRPDSPDVLAQTRLLDPGQSETITFRAPSAPGSYPFICGYPGHYISMKGTLEVK